MKKVEIEESWYSLLEDEFNKDYFNKIRSFIKEEYKNKTIFPPAKLIFNAFNLTPLNKIKVIIIGQDPYHGKGQAHGLSFSVPEDIKIPPSLLNIYKELKEDINKEIPKHGFLEAWANQGVLLLNSVLTVQSGKANSHKNIGWERFTESVIERVSMKKDKLVFLLWGNYAQKKENFIDSNKHLILKSVHPSPLSAYNGFFGSKHFSKTNNFLKKNNIKEILW
ncbi:MAG: uracil-DNA glycosylase [Candidatus Marinimicrobia bacterium]|nr:uracil-DNA glycosylase [Candidatus Neomarinimicrobiota bacterium]